MRRAGTATLHHSAFALSGTCSGEGGRGAHPESGNTAPLAPRHLAPIAIASQLLCQHTAGSTRHQHYVVCNTSPYPCDRKHATRCSKYVHRMMAAAMSVMQLPRMSGTAYNPAHTPGRTRAHTRARRAQDHALTMQVHTRTHYPSAAKSTQACTAEWCAAGAAGFNLYPRT